jgi:proteasome lid subunit RPN8/RPN11
MAHAHAAAPDEACGLIGGQAEGGVLRGEVAIAIPNVSPTPQLRYEMEARRMVEAIVGLRRRGLEVVGVYHSHPDDAPLPSRTDIAQATWPDVAYLIVGRLDTPTPVAQAWRLRYGEARDIPLIVE